MSWYATGSLPRHAATRWRCWSSRVDWRPRSWRAGLGCRVRRRFPPASREASSDGFSPLQPHALAGPRFEAQLIRILDHGYAGDLEIASVQRGGRGHTVVLAVAPRVIGDSDHVDEQVADVVDVAGSRADVDHTREQRSAVR